MLFHPHPYLLCFVLSLIGVALATEDTRPQPGDLFDYDTYVFPPWWFDLRDQYEFKEIRKCPFLRVIPDTLDYCPPVAKHADHYYCIFGTKEEPTWFCTCVENTVENGSDYHFHCSGTEVLTVEAVEHLASESKNMTESYIVTAIIGRTNESVEQPMNNILVQSGDDAGASDDNGDQSATVGAKSERFEVLVKSAGQEQVDVSHGGSKGSFTSGFASGLAAGIGFMLACFAVVFLIVSHSNRPTETTEFEYPIQASFGKHNPSRIGTGELMGRIE